MKPKREAFTLIELLVVIAIIATLSSLLIPVIGKALDRGRRTSCQSNLGQWATGLALYADAHQGKTFSYNTGFWPITLQPFMGDTLVSKDNEIQTQAITFCPSAREMNSSSGYNWGQFGTRTEMFRIFEHYGSYGFNWNLHKPAGNQTGDNLYRNLSDASSSTPAFMDSIWIDAGPQDAGSGSISWPSTLDGKNSAMGRVTVARHEIGINIGYADGHSSWVPLSRLWNQQWNAIYEPQGIQLNPSLGIYK